MADEDTATLVAETIADAQASVREKAKHAQEGDELFRADMPDGMGQLVRRKQNTMVRSGDTPLPERIRFYRSREGNESWLPTAQLAYYLAKKHADGTAVFVKERPGGERKPIDQTCAPCKKRSGKAKRFYDEFDYITHMESKHPRELRIQEKKEERERMSGGLLQALMGMDQAERGAIKALLGGSDGNSQGTASEGESRGAVGVQQPKQAGVGRVPCPGCGKSVKPRGLAIHQNRYCPSGGAS